MPLSPGRTLAHYKILGALGAGGMGEVYRASDSRLGRDVAIKVLPEAVAAEPEWRARFEREARTVAALNHPNIVVIHSIEHEGGVHFITMELIDGQTLDRLLQPAGLPLARMIELATPMVTALAAAHERGVVHRDLKPRNVMVTTDGRVKVLDFGLAKSVAADLSSLDSDSPTLQELSRPGITVGTMPYMSPEQVRGEPADARSDLFSFGIVLYEMATGRRPFHGASRADIASAVLRDTPEPLARVRPELGPEFVRIVERCLEKDPRARFQSAAELGVALRGLTSSDAAAAPASKGIRSLAVLPLENVSRDPAQEYFADGMTEALISDLARIKGLRVISRTSAMKYKGVQKSLPEIARELNVDAILEGSALLLGQRVRISVRLVSAGQDESLWSNRYDRDLVDVLDLQSNVAEAVAGEVALHLRPQEAARPAEKRAVNAEAHLEYLKGRHIEEATSPDAIEIALRHYTRAIELDPRLAKAWAGAADCHTTRAHRGMAPPAEAIAAARSAVGTALALDDSLAEAHAVLGGIQASEHDISGAIKTLTRAIELNPALSSALLRLGRVYYCIERHAEAQAAMHQALSVDPLSMIIHTAVGDAYYYARRYEQSVDYYRRAIALDPRFDGAHTDLARSLEALGQFEEARAEYETGRRLAGTVAGPSFGLAHLACSSGDTATARRILSELTEGRGARVVSAWGIAAMHASLGDADEAFRWFGTAIDEGATGLIFFRVHPRLDPIRGDARYAPMVKRLGLDVS